MLVIHSSHRTEGGMVLEQGVRLGVGKGVGPWDTGARTRGARSKRCSARGVDVIPGTRQA